ncbi:MAG: glycine cleavage system protein GcvH [Tissierellia bacterium]|nr:glycine cleavage system protein GcvH [Tissierellia bacterium]
MSKIVDELYYSEDHEWLKLDGDEAYIGITDYAQAQLGDIVYIELPEEGDSFEKDEDFGAVESVKAASELIMPVSGEVLEVNEDLNDQPEDVNEDAFGSWMIKINLEDPSQVEELMSGSEYKDYIEED